MAKKIRQRQEVKSSLPPQWKPAEGDVLEGLYIGSKQITAGSSTFLIHIIQDEETGEVLSLAGTQIDRMMRRILSPNAYVWITYEGKKQIKNGHNMHHYKLEVEKGVEVGAEEGFEAASGEVAQESDPSYLGGRTETYTDEERKAALVDATSSYPRA
jgi:hypothetical protein